MKFGGDKTRDGLGSIIRDSNVHRKGGESLVGASATEIHIKKEMNRRGGVKLEGTFSLGVGKTNFLTFFCNPSMWVRVSGFDRLHKTTKKKGGGRTRAHQGELLTQRK